MSNVVVIYRKLQQAFSVGDSIVRVVGHRRGAVKLEITAPDAMPVHRIDGSDSTQPVQKPLTSAGPSG